MHSLQTKLSYFTCNKVTRNIAQLLFQEGFLSNIEPETNGMFEVTLKRSVKTFKRVSTPGFAYM